MPATVITRVATGVGPSYSTVTNLRFKLADNNDQDSNNPCVKPTSGTHYSFWKTIELYCSVAPDTDVTNVKLYSDGTLGWTGCTVNVGDQMTEVYDQGVVDGGNADSGSEMTNHSQISSVTSLFTYTSGSPMSITEHSGWATPGATEPITAFVVLQLAITTSATGGAQAAETITWQYDET